MKLTEANKKRIQEVFSDIYESEEKAKNFKNHIKDIKKELSKDLDVSVEAIANAYTAWVRGKEKPELVKTIDQILSAL